MKKIIGFAGRKRSGKGMLSEVVRANCQNTVVITVASYLKHLCCDLLGTDYDTLNEWKDNGHTFATTPSERWLNLINKKTGISVEDIKKEIGGICFTNVRQMLQVIGTDLIRKYYPLWHVHCMVEDIKSYGDDHTIVVDDVRFPDERKAIEEMGGTVFFVIRPNCFDVSNHISETSLVWRMFDYDHIIINDLPKETLQEYFRIALALDFAKNNEIAIFLSANKAFQLGANYDFPSVYTEVELAKDILGQNMANSRFLKNGIIIYHAGTREKAIAFNEYVCNTSCQDWKRDYVVYNPLINENLKKYINQK